MLISGHNAALLQTLTTVGPAGVGTYCALHEDADIPLGIGECLGAAHNLVLQHLQLEGAVQVQVGAGPERCLVYGARLDQAHGGISVEPMPEASVPYLTGEQVYTVVLVSDMAPVSGATLVLRGVFQASGRDQQERFELRFPLPNAGPCAVLDPARLSQLSLEDDEQDDAEQAAAAILDGAPAAAAGATAAATRTPAEELALWTASDLRVAVHLLRLEVAGLLNKMTLAGSQSLLPVMSQTHTAVMALISLVRRLPDTPEVIADEGILLTLERDLGEALGMLHDTRAVDARKHSLFLAFAHEHAVQRSANAASRTSYSGRQQLAMRLRFLAGSSGADAIDRTALPADEPGLPPGHVAKRRDRDDDGWEGE